MPKHVTYPGPHATVTVVGHDGPIEQGESVELDSDLADRLVDQGWKSAREANAIERKGGELKPPDDVTQDPTPEA